MVPRLVYLQTDTSGISRLFSQPDLPSQPSALALSLLAGCPIYRLYPNPVVALLAVEFQCGGGPVVQVYDLQASQSLDLGGALQTWARFLAWSADGRFLYLRTNPLTDPQVIRLDRLSKQALTLSLPSTLYDLATLPDGRIVYSTTQGIGFGSQTWQAQADGRRARLILSEPQDIVAYLRPSPNGKQVAFILFPDSQTPYPNGELRLMDADGSNPHDLADADAGHGYAPAWSPDGTQIAFVVRINPSDSQTGTSGGTLPTNIYLIEVQSGALSPVTTFANATVETPTWSPDGTALFFNVIRNDTIRVWFDQGGALQSLNDETGCCAVWVPGR